MEENRDPIKCTSCETVNPWFNEHCRTCGELLTSQDRVEAEPEEPILSVKVESPTGETPVDIPLPPSSSEDGRDRVFTASIPPRRRWNILWILLGMFFYLISLWVGEFFIVRWVIAPDPELRSAVEEMSTLKTPEDLDTQDQERLRSVLFSNGLFVFSLALLFLIPPLVIGSLTGFYAGGVLEGSAAMGLSAVVLFLIAGQALIAVLAGPINAGLGALGAYLGRLLRQKTR